MPISKRPCTVCVLIFSFAGYHRFIVPSWFGMYKSWSEQAVVLFEFTPRERVPLLFYFGRHGLGVADTDARSFVLRGYAGISEGTST